MRVRFTPTLLLAFACANDPDLIVDVVTDYVPSVEFSSVITTVNGGRESHGGAG